MVGNQITSVNIHLVYDSSTTYLNTLQRIDTGEIPYSHGTKSFIV